MCYWHLYCLGTSIYIVKDSIADMSLVFKFLSTSCALNFYSCNQCAYFVASRFNRCLDVLNCISITLTKLIKHQLISHIHDQHQTACIRRLQQAMHLLVIYSTFLAISAIYFITNFATYTFLIHFFAFQCHLLHIFYVTMYSLIT